MSPTVDATRRPRARRWWLVGAKWTLSSAAIVSWLSTVMIGPLLMLPLSRVLTLPPASALPPVPGMHRVGPAYCAGDPMCGGVGGRYELDDSRDGRDPYELALAGLEHQGWSGRGPRRQSPRGDFYAQVSYAGRTGEPRSAARIEVYFATPEAGSRQARGYVVRYFAGLVVLTAAALWVATVENRRTQLNEVRQR